MKLSRRHLLKSSLAGITASSFTQHVMSALNNKRTKDTFQHGIASGEPSADGILLWTRINQNNELTPTVSWQLATDPEFKKIVQSGQQSTNAQQDFCIKVAVKQLKPGAQYFYRFQYQGITSEPGRTRTLPTGELRQLCLAVASCSNFPFGYFNAYEVMAADQDIDFVLHLGDYIYEYGVEGYGGTTGKAINRDHQPSHEIISLADYRQRHAQYKSDTASRLLHASHPIIAIWDDHESANNPYMGGAQNHQSSEGSWEKRRAASLQAYYEWMPIHTPASGVKLESLWRSFEFGNLASLVTLETRHTGRNKQIDYSEHLAAIKTTEDRDYFLQNILGQPNRTMLSPEMESFYQRETQRSLSTGKHWRLLGNQIPMARTHVPDLRKVSDKNKDGSYDPVAQKHAQFRQLGEFNLPLYLDTWDGYPAAREAFYQINKDLGAQDLLVLTGDSHSFWANQLFDATGQAMGLELGTAGITSPGDFEGYGADTATLMDKLIAQHNPEIYWTDGQHRGFIKLSLTQKQAKAEFITVDNILTEQYQVNRLKTLIIEKQGKSIIYR